MEYSSKLEKTSDTNRKLLITIPSTQIRARYDRVMVEQQSRASVKGFRPGHVPLQMVKKVYGEDVKQKVFDQVVNEATQRAMEEHQVRIVGRPHIHRKKPEGVLLVEDGELEFEAHFEVFPEIEIKHSAGFQLKKPKVDVQAEDVEAVVSNLQTQHAEMTSVPEDQAASHVVAKGEFVDTLFKGMLWDNDQWEEKPGMSGTQLIEIGSGQMIPGFEDALLGLKKGESKQFEIQFPEDYGAEGFQGKKAKFEVTAQDIRIRRLPELDDEFAKEAGYESMADLRTKAKNAVERSQTEQSDAALRQELVSELVSKNPFELPKALLHAQMQSLMTDFAENLKRRGMPEDRIRGAIETNAKDFETQAERQVRAGLLLDKISEMEKIEIQEADFESEYQKVAAGTQMKLEDVKAYYEKTAKAKENLEFRIRENKTIQHILGQSKIKEVDAPAPSKKKK